MGSGSDSSVIRCNKYLIYTLVLQQEIVSCGFSGAADRELEGTGSWHNSWKLRAKCGEADDTYQVSSNSARHNRDLTPSFRLSCYHCDFKKMQLNFDSHMKSQEEL